MISFNKIFKSSLVLMAITLALFFALYFYFSLNGTVSVKDYYTYSFMICCFVVLPLYALYCFFTIFNLSKIKAKHHQSSEDLMTFKEGFKVGFYTIFFAGIMSLIVIFVFFNTYGEWAQDSLKQGLLDTFTLPVSLSYPSSSKAFFTTSFIFSINIFITLPPYCLKHIKNPSLFIQRDGIFPRYHSI